MEDVLSFAQNMQSEKVGFKSTKPTTMPSNSTNALVLSKLERICFEPVKVRIESRL